MPVAVACQCGQRFAAQDHLRGKQVACPACGGPLIIPAPPQASAPAPAPAASAPAGGIRVACGCGQAFLAPTALQGTAARCPACGGTIQIPAAHPPAQDILSVDPLMAMGGGLPAANASPLHSRVAAISSSSSPNVAVIGGLIAAAALVLIAVVTVLAMTMRGSSIPIAQPPPAAPGGAPSNFGSAPFPPSSGASMPPAAPSVPGNAPATGAGNAYASTPSASPTGTNPTSTAPAATPAASAFSTATMPAPVPASTGPLGTPPGQFSNPMGPLGTPPGSSVDTRASASSNPLGRSAFQEASSEEAAKVGFLPSSVQTWHTQDNRRLQGLTRVGDSEASFAHYSWMTHLLPFLGHQKEYDRIDFSRPMTTPRNISVGLEVIPAFLNPLDDRPKWKGYPFGGLGLTHFAGMSGIEDTRNVVAATLPRSDPRAGIFGYDEVARPDEITDGQSQTIMVVGTGALASPWLFGGGATIRGAREPYFDKVSGLGTRNLPQEGAIAVMADGSVRFISAKVDPAVFRAMCTIRGSDSVDLESSSQPFLLESIEK